jgi:hypothetical protein
LVLSGLTQDEVDAQALKAKGDSVVAIRQGWFHNVGDPLYFKEQRGEVPVGSWKQAVADMKAANPYPEGYAK